MPPLFPPPRPPPALSALQSEPGREVRLPRGAAPARAQGERGVSARERVECVCRACVRSCMCVRVRERV